MTRTIQPVCLPNQGEQLTTGSKLYVTGWGEVGGGRSAQELKQVMVSAISHQECRRFRHRIIPQAFCGGHQYGSTCGGDSGSPVVHFANGQWSLHGIVSAGPRVEVVLSDRQIPPWPPPPAGKWKEWAPHCCEREWRLAPLEASGQDDKASSWYVEVLARLPGSVNP
ncbi:chymotrypsin-like protease CTRL-1 [Ixodes scapularis]